MSADVPEIDIRPDHWGMVQGILQKHVPQFDVWAFGSRAKWTAKDHSDLDLCIKTDKPLDFKTLALMEEDFSESDLPWKVDVVDWATTSESFRKIIERDKVVVQKAGRGVTAFEWRATTWGEEVSLEYGKAIRGYQEAKGKFRVFGSNGPVGWTDNAIADGPGVILGRKGAYRGVQFSREPFWVIDTAYFVVPKTELDMRWLYYAIQHYKLGEIDDGSPIPSTTRAAVYMRELSVPPLEEQHAIAETLGALDDRIANLRQTNATLQAIAAALFKSRFVDFDGVPQEGMQESELGLIPKGWRAYAFGEIATLGKGSVNPATQPQTVFQHYSLPAFDAGQMPIAETGQAIKSNKTPVPSGAVLVSKLNPHIPRIWFVGETGDSAVCSTEFLVWTPKPGIGSAFIYFVATSPEFNATMRQLVTGTSNSHQRVKPDQLTSAHAAIASKESIAAFDEAIAPMLKKIEHNRQQAATLAALRDTLLPRLISGRLRVIEQGQSKQHGEHP
jgi:type I restriction enzyme S subunit